MTDELEKFYQENHSMIDDRFAEFCFYEGRFETLRDADLHYNNERAFWEFVQDTMDSRRNWG